MTPEGLFAIAGPVALLGWLALLVSPLRPVLAQRVAAVAVPLVLSVGYAGLVLAHLAGAEGGFGTLAEVALLFANPWLLLAGWVHYLAFDLLVGAWIARTAQREGVPHWQVVPCLGLTFLLGPVGFLCFAGLRVAHARLAHTRLARAAVKG